MTEKNVVTYISPYSKVSTIFTKLNGSITARYHLLRVGSRAISYIRWIEVTFQLSDYKRLLPDIVIGIG